MNFALMVDKISQPINVYLFFSKNSNHALNFKSATEEAVVLHVLDSSSEVELLLRNGDQVDLLLIEIDAYNSLEFGCKAGLHNMPIIVIDDDPSELEIQNFIKAGVLNVVPADYALSHLVDLTDSHRSECGIRRPGQEAVIVTIDYHRAIAQMQSDIPFYGRLLRAFLEELPIRRRQLREYWLNDPSQIVHFGHSLKGLALTLGLGRLALVAAKAENNASELLNNQSRKLDIDLLNWIEGEIQSAGFQIRRWLNLYEKLS